MIDILVSLHAGVITLYRAQMFEIRRMLAGKDGSSSKGVQVNTCDLSLKV